MNTPTDEVTTLGGYCARTPLTQRIWRSLGFRYHLGEEPEGIDNLEGWMCTEMRMRFSFLDRLRLLATGRLHIKLVQHLPVRCDFSRNRMDWQIEPFGDR